jgi:hypothetical protein
MLSERASDLTGEAKIVPSCCFRNILRENADNVATNDSAGVELGRCKPLNGFAHEGKLRMTRMRDVPVGQNPLGRQPLVAEPAMRSIHFRSWSIVDMAGLASVRPDRE